MISGPPGVSVKSKLNIQLGSGVIVGVGVWVAVLVGVGVFVAVLVGVDVRVVVVVGVCV